MQQTNFAISTFKEEKGLNAFAENIDSCQLAQSTQADIGRKFLILSHFLFVKEPFHFVTSWTNMDFMYP